MWRQDSDGERLLVGDASATAEDEAIRITDLIFDIKRGNGRSRFMQMPTLVSWTTDCPFMSTAPRPNPV